MPKLLFQDHGSCRFTSNSGMVIYVDPFAPKGYDLPADLILITHGHSDHNQVSLVTQKPGCCMITSEDALAGGKHQSFTVGGVEITAVEANNARHDPKLCVGYLLTIDGVRIYASGDTSKTEQMGTFAPLHLDYAILPVDGIFNMGPEEASECARIIGAKHTIPIHTSRPNEPFERPKAEKLDAPGRIILNPGEEIDL